MTMRIAALAAAMAGVSIGLASSANAELTPGHYYDGTDWVFTSCGQGCLLREGAGNVIEFRLQGKTWSRVNRPDEPPACWETIDDDSLMGTIGCGTAGLDPTQLIKVD